MESCVNQNFAACQLGDKRLDKRALVVGQALVLGFGEARSMIFENKNLLKRAYEFFANSKVQFNKLAQPHWRKTALNAQSLNLILAVGDTTFLNYNQLKAKRDGYGPIGNGGNGLILHSTLAVEPEQGQPLGLLWEKLWHREGKSEPVTNETTEEKKVRLALQRQAKRDKAFEQKESYRWVEAFKAVETQFQELKKHGQNPQQQQTDNLEILGLRQHIVQIFDREGDIAEVFAQVGKMEFTGVVVRATHNRSLNMTSTHLWQYLQAQSIQFYKQVELPATTKRKARIAKLAVRFSPVQLRSPRRFDTQNLFEVYAVYATEIDPPDGEQAVSWMLLTTETVTDATSAAMILRWYTYRWHIEEYHKILKSGCRAETYRLAATTQEALLGFLTVISAELLRVTYLERTQPQAPATTILTPVQLDVLKAKSPHLPKALTVAWAVSVVARLGGYLEHRRKTPIGIQVLWRGWLKLSSLCEGWQLATPT